MQLGSLERSSYSTYVTVPPWLQPRNYSKRSIDPLLMFLQGSPGINQKELVGLLKAVADHKAFGRDNADIALRELLRCLVRNKQTSQYATELATCKEMIDSGLTRQFNKLKKAGVSALTWLQSNDGLAAILMRKDDIDVVVASQGKWREVAAPVARLTSSSALGAALFGFAAALVHAAVFEDQIQGEIQKALKSDVSLAVVNDLKLRCLTFASDLKRSTVTGQKRTISVTFAAEKLQLVVADVALEIHLRLMAAVKSEALLCGHVKRLPYELWVLPSVHSHASIKIDPDVLAECAQCRAQAAEMLQESGAETFMDMKRVLSKNAAVLTTLDPSFRLELSFLEDRAEEVLKQKVQNELLELLPSPKKQSGMVQCLAKVQELSKSDLISYAPPAVKAMAASLEEIVAGLVKGVGPDNNVAASSGFFKAVMLRLPYFLSEEIAEEGGGVKMLQGAAALAAQMDKMAVKMQKQDAVRLADLQQFQSFKFLMDAQQKDQLSKWVKNVLAAGPDASTGSSSSSTKILAETKPAAAAVATSVMSYFG